MEEKIGVVTMVSLLNDRDSNPFKELFIKPQSYNFIPFPNPWDNKTPLWYFKAFRNDKEEDI